jgi:hypothetical protein
VLKHDIGSEMETLWDSFCHLQVHLWHYNCRSEEHLGTAGTKGQEG